MESREQLAQKIVHECIDNGVTDRVLRKLLESVLSEKEVLRAQCQWQGASLKAVRKIADGTGDGEAIKALCEENEECVRKS